MKEELIQIGGKSYKKCDVVMLPTKEQRWKVGNQHDDRYESYSFVDKKLYSRQSNAHNWSLSHLYILSSEKIKEGDWYMYCHFGEWIISNSRETLKNKTNTLENLNKDDYFKKIIATTDDLIVTKQIGTISTGKAFNSKLLPRPSDDFIRAFVKAQGKGFDKVLVEYIKLEEPTDDGNSKKYIQYDLKILPDNTITIKPIQEQKTSWSREELELFFKWMLDNRVYLDTNGCIEYKIPYEKEQGMSDIFDKYLKQNL